MRTLGSVRARAGSVAFGAIAGSAGAPVEPPTEMRDLWSRRRKIDGSLNRVPPQFFERTYCILERLQGLRIGEHTLTTTLTKEVCLKIC